VHVVVWRGQFQGRVQRLANDGDFANRELLSNARFAAAIVVVCALNGCHGASPSGKTLGGVSELPPEPTEAIFGDNYAQLFLSECHKHASVTANGVCERLLYSERAKQVWSGEVYAEAHAVPLHVATQTNKASWKAYRRPDRKEVYAAIPYVPDPNYADQPWIHLADMRNLTDDEADRIEAAFTRTEHLKWQDLKK
jgi:hypothetical protein